MSWLGQTGRRWTSAHSKKRLRLSLSRLRFMSGCATRSALAFLWGGVSQNLVRVDEEEFDDLDVARFMDGLYSEKVVSQALGLLGVLSARGGRGSEGGN